MVTKKLFAALLTAGTMLSAVAGTIPEEAPAISFKSRAGTAEKESNRTIKFYLKSSVPGATFHVQWGDSTATQEVTCEKANTLSKVIQLKNITTPDIEVKVWGKTINFFNCNNDSVYEVNIGQDGKKIKEFRCENNPFTDISFFNDIDSLEYIVMNSNKRLKSINLKGDKLMRVQLGTLIALESINIAGPKIYEFKMTAPLIQAIDLSRCPDIKTAYLYEMTNCRTVTLGNAEKLTSLQVTKSNVLTSLELCNLPSLKDVAVTSCPAFNSIKLENLPNLTTIQLNANGFTSFEVPDFPLLERFTINNNAALTSVTFACTSLIKLELDKLPMMKEVNLSKLANLKTLYLRDGGCENIIYNPETWINMSSALLTNNHLTFSTIPIRPKAYKETVNYYAPQAQPAIPYNISTGNVVDLSAWSQGNSGSGDIATVYKWITKFDEELVENVDYTVENGKFTFIRECEDSVRCELSNEAFPRFERTVSSKGVVTDNRVFTNYTVIEKGTTTGVTEVTAANGNCPIEVNGRTITVQNQAAPVIVYDASGRTVGKGLTVTVSQPGIYLARYGTNVSKLIIR